MSDFEQIKEGGKRIRWPWTSLTEIGQSFSVTEPKNVKNGRQSVFQANKRFGKIFKGDLKDGVFVVTRIA